MGTPFDEIFDLFLMEIKDYRIQSMVESDLKIYLEGFLMLAIPEFDNCVKDLEDYDLNSDPPSFSVTLTLREKTILSKLMVMQWLLKEIQDVTQLKNHLSDTDFKIHSEAQNLKAKSDYYNSLKETISQSMVSYGLKNAPWTDWAGGTFEF